ncbi:MAG TPA: hypothetical protein VFS67_21725 [Polyangiaceae bacterium]|nr:hypothetical protein [Polyangiaceae bacterium]
MSANAEAMGALAELFGALFEPLLRKVVREEMDARNHPSDDWRDQKQDRLLTPRQHCAAVRRRLAADPNDPWAKKIGKSRYLLTTDAIAEELDRLGRSTVVKAKDTKPQKPLSPEDEARLRVQRRLQRVK